MNAEPTPTTTALWPFPSKLADWTPEQRSRAARQGWQRRRDPQWQARARLDALLRQTAPRTLRLYACDLAEAVLPIWEATAPDDLRLSAVLQVARRYAIGRASDRERMAAGAIAVATSLEIWPPEEHAEPAPAAYAVCAVNCCTWKRAGDLLREVQYWARLARGEGSRLSHFHDGAAEALLAGLQAYLAAAGAGVGA